MSEELLRVSHLSVSMDGRRLLQGIGFSAFSGEILAVCGLRFTGKSVLARLIAGQPYPYEGSILYPAAPSGGRTMPPAGYLYYIGQGGLAFGPLNIADVFFAVRRPRRRQLFYRERCAGVQTAHILRKLNIPLAPEAPASALSPAQAHRLQVEKAVSLGAKVIVLDSVGLGYTQGEYQALLQVMRSHNEAAYVYLGSGEDPVTRSAQRVLVIRNGYPAGLMYHDQYDSARFETMLKGKHTLRPPAHVSHGIAGREAARFLRPRGELSLLAGEIVGLYDESGAAAEAYAAALALAPGDCLALDGKPPKDYAAAVRLGLGVITHNYAADGLFPQLSAQDNLAFQMLPRISRLGFTPAHMLNYLQKTAPCAYGVEGAPGPLETVLMKWALSRPRVLVVENVLTGLDPRTRGNAYRILDRISAEGTAVLFLSSSLQDLENLCDRILPL